MVVLQHEPMNSMLLGETYEFLNKAIANRDAAGLTAVSEFAKNTDELEFKGPAIGALICWGDIGLSTISAVAEKAIIGEATNEGGLKAVKAKFPHAATSMASISWYRSKLRKERPDILTDRQTRESEGG